MRLRSCTLFCAVCLALVLTACGTQGYAPPLGKSARATLTNAADPGVTITASLTPAYATHVAVYFKGQPLPLTGAQTPAQLRQGSCFGPVVAPLSDGNAPAGVSSTPDVKPVNSEVNTVTTAPDPAGGTDVDVAPGAQWYVTVLTKTNNPDAPVAACGSPLSERRQYFDLYPPQNNSIAIGNALQDPILATHITFSGPSLASAQPTSWAVHTDNCSGPVVASGSVSQNRATVFKALDAKTWWLSLTFAADNVLCGQVNQS